MNPQPTEAIGQIFGFIFACICGYYFWKAYSNPAMHIQIPNDLFTIGYVEDSPIIHKTITNNVVTNTKPSFESQQLYLDCIDALHALGMKKLEAKKRAKQIFSTMNPQPSTVQEFLIIALKQ